MRCGQDEPLSSDNCPLISTNGILLGRQRLAGIHDPVIHKNTPPSIGNIVELKGLVHPSDFSDTISFGRDNVDEYVAEALNGHYSVLVDNQGKTRGFEPSGNDSPPTSFQDINPRPNGAIYDIDTPGEYQHRADNLSHGTIRLIRLNFKQYAFWRGRRCSDDFLWFSRTTILRTFDEYELPTFDFLDRQGFSHDNACGPGSTSLTP